MSQFTRSHRYTVVSLFSLMFLGLFLACGASASNTGTLTGTGTGTAKPVITTKHFKVGDKVTVGNLFEVTINSFATNPGTDFSKPAAGNQFVVVDVTFKNISTKEQNLSSILQYTLKDSTGQKYNTTFLDGLGATPEGTLAVGDLVKGQLAYEVPATQKQFTFTFEADPFSGGLTTWDLSL